MKSKEELNALKEEVEALKAKAVELSDDKLQEVSGGLTQREIEKINSAIEYCRRNYFDSVNSIGDNIELDLIAYMLQGVIDGMYTLTMIVEFLQSECSKRPEGERWLYAGILDILR